MDNQVITDKEVTRADYFRNKRQKYNATKKLEMPSGVVFEVRRPDIVRMIRNGLMPASVAVDISNMTERAVSSQKNGKTFQMTEDEFKKYSETLDTITVATVVSPKVKIGDVSDAEYDDGYISIDDIDYQDKNYLFAFANTGTEDLKSFRTQE